MNRPEQIVALQAMNAAQMIDFLSDLIDEEGMPVLLPQEVCLTIQRIAYAQSLQTIGEDDED